MAGDHQHRHRWVTADRSALTVANAMGRRRQWSLIVLELLVALSATYGGVGLIWDNAIGMPADWLRATPFTSWVLPGILLLLVVGVPMGVAAAGEIARAPWAALASVVAGAAQVGWIGVQLVVMQRYNVLQPVMLGVGLMIMLLAVWSGRRRPLFPRWLLPRRLVSGQVPQR